MCNELMDDLMNQIAINKMDRRDKKKFVLKVYFDFEKTFEEKID